MNDCFGCMHPYPAGHWFYSLQDLLAPLLENPLFYVFSFFFAGMIGAIISRIIKLIKTMKHSSNNKVSIDNYDQIEIERYMTNEEVGKLVINFMKRTNGEPLLIVFPEYDNGDNNDDKNTRCVK
ncbi:hypothetical protein O2741_002598 [Shigella sonnei]|uniref:hypothetical protein n=1 Tax=Escherichia coli TaxID=562 RepID=UPI0005CFAA8C|nr:hypothetical protein [Escherichia coli]EBU3900804.1 hypothetical protein [Salmonella enterica]EFX0657396.1 hypothetical protein [Shigella sonnei]EKD5305605.1 hypothetical protein [Shigella flexneri]EDI4770487.1 hypothetical protein [Salmonella enterica]EES9627710.1 hypothetical protein [Escherichia coli]